MSPRLLSAPGSSAVGSEWADCRDRHACVNGFSKDQVLIGNDLVGGPRDQMVLGRSWWVGPIARARSA